VTAEQRWLAALWPKVRLYLPPAPALIVEIGCGPLGGFVPRLRESGYEAVGIDPLAPEGDSYRQVEFEQSDLAAQLDGVIACTSQHHVIEPGDVLDKIANAMAPGGRVIVVEWDWENFDEATARWCFERLERSDAESWLHRRRAEWTASQRAWEDYLRDWAHQHGLHSARRLLGDLDRHFQRTSCTRGPYFFPELFQTGEADELGAINAGQIRAARIDYVGRLADP
jgi:SAM-dependent methyltransferase